MPQILEKVAKLAAPIFLGDVRKAYVDGAIREIGRVNVGSSEHIILMDDGTLVALPIGLPLSEFMRGVPTGWGYYTTRSHIRERGTNRIIMDLSEVQFYAAGLHNKYSVASARNPVVQAIAEEILWEQKHSIRDRDRLEAEIRREGERRERQREDRIRKEAEKISDLRFRNMFLRDKGVKG
jgi:hypothetical protein